MTYLTACAGTPPAKRQLDSANNLPPSAIDGLVTGKIIDGIWAGGKHQELQTVRTGQPGLVDSCVKDLGETNTFAERIAYFVNLHMTPEIVEHYVHEDSKDPLDVYQTFDIPKTGTMATSLMSHEMCIDSDVSFKAQLANLPTKPAFNEDGTVRKDSNGKYDPDPDPETLQLAQKFENLYNRYRKVALETKDSTQLQGLWTRFMDCLAYSESLDGPDSEKAKGLALKHRPTDEQGNPSPKPVGVEFYMDTTPDPKVRQLTIGLFQFTPGAMANQYPCAAAWNKEYPSCKVDPSNEETHTWALSSPYQTYNAFCGTDKIVESFFTQVNATTAEHTNVSNVFADGTIKAPKDRCVTPFFKSKLSFNHFGPLQNSVDNQVVSNLKKELLCAVGDL